MQVTIGIAGAGLAGRLIALQCLQRGYAVTLFDADDQNGLKSCGWTAAGMIAPYSELESSELLLCELGLKSLQRWPEILAMLEQPVSFHQDGTLIVAHPQDAPELERFYSHLQHKLSAKKIEHLINPVDRKTLEEFAPALSPLLQTGYRIPSEGHINNLEFFQATTQMLRVHQVNWHCNTTVKQVLPHQIILADKKYQFDMVFDCRGLAAKNDLSELRGVRGEIVWLKTDEVNLRCPVRVMHPRYPLYIVPRSDQHFVIGATSIESEDTSPISAQSMLELLSAAYVVHSGFAEARIIQTLTNCRPAFSDHQPKIFYSDGLIQINGLYRHGYMIGPAVTQDAMRLFEEGKRYVNHPEIFRSMQSNALLSS